MVLPLWTQFGIKGLLYRGERMHSYPLVFCFNLQFLSLVCVCRSFVFVVQNLGFMETKEQGSCNFEILVWDGVSHVVFLVCSITYRDLRIQLRLSSAGGRPVDSLTAANQNSGRYLSHCFAILLCRSCLRGYHCF